MVTLQYIRLLQAGRELCYCRWFVLTWSHRQPGDGSTCQLSSTAMRVYKLVSKDLQESLKAFCSQQRRDTWIYWRWRYKWMNCCLYLHSEKSNQDGGFLNSDSCESIYDALCIHLWDMNTLEISVHNNHKLYYYALRCCYGISGGFQPLIVINLFQSRSVPAATKVTVVGKKREIVALAPWS